MKQEQKQRYTLRDCESGVELEIEAESLADAHRQANAWQVDAYPNVERTIWVDTQIRVEGETVSTAVTQIDPPEPKCSGGEHEWTDDIALVGGIKENPGVWGHGAGVLMFDACKRCGCQRTIDTWAQRPDTGQEGFSSVSYEPNHWSDDQLRDAGYGDAL